MGITLHHFPPSAPSRCALLVCKVLGIDVDVHNVDLFAKEQLSADFVKINVQHTVPTIVDGDFTLWESRAIASYLVRTYGKNDSLYPSDMKKRAIVDQRLYFDCGTLYPRIRAICFPVLFLDEIEISEDKKTALDEVLGFLDVFLDGQDFVAGNELTIADIACITSLSSIIVRMECVSYATESAHHHGRVFQAVGWDVTPYANVASWVARCSLAIPGYAEHNQVGADLFGKAVKSKLAPGQI